MGLLLMGFGSMLLSLALVARYQLIVNDAWRN